jgi:hypothetical protein
MNRLDLAFTHHSKGDLARAEALYRAMISDGEDVASAANNLLLLLHGQRRSTDLAALYQTIEPLIPANGDWAYARARFLLSREDYEAGWQWYEARRHISRSPVLAPVLSLPEWDGGPVRRLLVCPEQGLGDQIQFARYLPELARRGVEATLLCHRSLKCLFSNLAVEVVPLSGEVRLGEFDAWCLLGSLPHLLGAASAIPAPISVSATPRRARGVGVVTSGSPTHIHDVHRSMPAEAAARLLALPDAVPLAPEATGARDFQDTADIIAGLDLVVTVDTSVAHLAGSMGKPTFVLLAAAGQDWRWLQDRQDSPWYPSVRLFRQAAPGDWNGLLDQTLAAVAAQGEAMGRP